MMLSVVVPIYNDGYLVDSFCLEFEKVKNIINSNGIEEVELIFVNDGSLNNSFSELVKVTEKYPYVKIIDLSRNFGQHIALSCGYNNAEGDYVAMLNVDMQDPPQEIIKLLDFIMQNDVEIVYSTVKLRKTSFMNRLTSKIFNSFLNFLTKNNTPANVSTLRIMTKKFINTYNELSEKSRYLPGLESWIGYKSGYVEINHQQRKFGKSSYNFRSRLKLALETVISFSDYPLRLIVSFGVVISLIGFFWAIYLIFSKLFFKEYQSGYISIMSLIIFMSGILMFVIGFSALYIGRILKEVQNRPLYIINKKINF